MASLSRFLRSIRPQDLRSHLQISGIAAPEAVDWAAPAERIAEQFRRSLDRLSDDQRDRLIADAERISAMSDEPGQAALLALVDYRNRLMEIEGAHARAHWLYVQSHEAFRRAEEIRYADENREALRLWDGFVGPRLMDICSDPAADQRFREQLRDILESGRIFLEPLTRMRGHADEPTRLIRQLAIYNEGLPSDDLRFDGEQIVPFIRRPVLETVIVYEPDSGTIEVIGSVKKLRERLAKAFAETKLGVAIPGERLPMRRFDLTPLLDPGHLLAFDPGDGIARVKLTMLTLSDWDNGLIQRFEIPFEDNETTLSEALAAQYGVRNPLLSSLRPVCARIDVRFQPLPGQRVGKKVSVTITGANKCNLRGKTAQERLILDRYLRGWGLYRGR
jgi:hypothetical protein